MIQTPSKQLDELTQLSFDCFYWDIRIEDTQETKLKYRQGELLACDSLPSRGAFLRVFNRGKWFYTATTKLQDLKASLEDLVQQSKKFPETPISSGVLKRFGRSLKPLQAQRFLYTDQSVHSIPVAEKRRLCESYLPLFKKFPAIKTSVLNYGDLSMRKYFLSSRGIRTAFDYQHAGISLNYTLQENQQIFQDTSHHFGCEFSALQGLEGKILSDFEESHRFLKAPMIEAGTYRVVLESIPVGVFAHESFGHKSEADFMLGDDHALSAWRIGAKVGSEVLSIVDDGTHVGSSGDCPWDDEGVPAQKTYLIKNGILTGRLHSLTTAMELDEEPTGNGRSTNFEFEPIVRMTSTFIEPGECSFEELLTQAKEGFYIKTVRYGTGMSTFTMAPARSYRIQEGKISEPVRINVLSGNVFETLSDIEACSREFYLESSALGGCGKLEQWPLPVALGGPKILVSRMNAS